MINILYFVIFIRLLNPQSVHGWLEIRQKKKKKIL